MRSTNRRARRLVTSGVAIVALAVLAGCGDDDDDDEERAPEAATLELTATVPGGASRRAIEAPKSIRPGLVEITLRNTDNRDREAQIVRITGSRTDQDVIKVVTTEGGPIPDWIQDGGGVPPVKPGKTGRVTQVLRPGTYVIFDTGQEGDNAPTNAEMGATARLEVMGPAGDDELPAVPARITAREYSFTASGLKAGRNRVRFANAGRELHHALLFPLNPGATIAQARRFFSEENARGRPPVNFDRGTGTAVIDGGVAQNVELDLRAGRYAAVCFIQDRKGGPPHVAKGMISAVTVE